MDRELFHLVDTQMEVLDMLSIDCGLTNRELTRLLGRRERDEGNVSGKYVKPLLDAGVVYQVSGEEYPKKELYIKKSVNNMDKIQHALADPVEGKIWQYAQEKKMKCNEPSDVYLRAVELLAASIHLYIWCRMISSDLRMAGREAYEKEKFAEHHPECIFYRRYTDERNRVLRWLPYIHNRRDLEKLVDEFEEIQIEKDCRAMGIVIPTAEELARAFRSPASGHIETYISPARRVHTMAGATKIQNVTIDEIELEACEIRELDRLAEETRKCGISWEDLKAELGLDTRGDIY